MSELTRKKNEASEIMFAMVDSATPANLKSGLTVTDDPYYRDGAGAWTALTIADTATEIGSTGMYTIEMTAAEMNHDLILIKLTGTGAADTIVVIRTTTHDIDDVLQADITQIGGVTQSATDLKDLADTGYDPATHKVQGVVLVDTNTDMRGTDSAATATSLTTHDGKLDTVDTVVDGIQTDLSNTTDGLGALKALIDTVDGVVDTILTDTNELQTNQGNWLTATGFSTHNAAAVWSVATRILTASTNFNDLTAAEVKAEAVAALADIKLDHLINIAVDTDWATTVHLDSVLGHIADVGTAATFDRTTDALEAIRDRGDGAWTTGAGGSSPTVGEIRAELEGAGYFLDLIKADTNELQTNQGNWLTATGFSVPNEYDTVIAALQTDLDNPAQYKATGFSTHSAADVWTSGTRALTDKAGFSLLSTGADLISKDSTFALAIADATWDEILTGATHNIATSAGRRLREASDTMVLRSEETAQAGAAGSITLAAAASAIDHFYDKATIIIIGGTGIGQARTIAEYAGSTKVATVCENWATTPDNTSVYVIRGHTCCSVFNINTDALAQINTECDTALTDYDPPTRAEATSDKNAIITEVNANETKIDTVDGIVDAILVDTGATLENHMTDIKGTGFVKDTDSLPQCLTAIGFATAGVCTEARLAELDVANLPTDATNIEADTQDLQTQIGTAGAGLGDLGGMSVSMMGEVQTKVNDALTGLNLDHLIKDPVDTSFANTVHLDSALGHMVGVGGSATFSRTTDSQEAIRNRGDDAWTTGGAGSISEILNVQALIPNSIDLANTATVRIALGLTNMVDDLPSTAEITSGTITIDHKAIGATSWTNVVNTAACSELAGLVYYDEVFDTATGYAAGDSVRITFKSQKITVDANDFEITGADGWTFQTHIREAMRGTDLAALATTWTDEKAAFLDHSIATTQADLDTITGSDGVTLATQQLNYAPNTVIPDAMGTAAGLHATTNGKVDAVQTDATAIKAKTDALPSGIAKNVALSGFNTFMVLSSDHVSAGIGKTVTGTISKDGGVFNALTNSVTEIGSGMYKVDVTQSEMDADVVTLKFVAADCDARITTIYTG